MLPKTLIKIVLIIINKIKWMNNYKILMNIHQNKKISVFSPHLDQFNFIPLNNCLNKVIVNNHGIIEKIL